MAALAGISTRIHDSHCDVRSSSTHDHDAVISTANAATALARTAWRSRHKSDPVIAIGAAMAGARATV
jgi:hypothetical protein